MREDEINKKRLSEFGPLALVSKYCIGQDRLPVMYGTREAPNNVSDSGWTFSSGNESPEFGSKPDDYVLVPIKMMVETDLTLEKLRDMPEGTEVTRLTKDEPWRFIVNGKVVDEDGNVVGELE